MSGVTPSALESMPKVLPHQGFYLDAFQTLSDWRGFTSMGDQAPVELAAIVSYCTLFEIKSVEMRATLVHLVKRMDMAYLRGQAKRQGTDTEPKADVA